jgi:succinate dehydrogenase / fumarate reductase flavoprotein subunit
LIQQELGRVMTNAATVVRHNGELRDAYAKVCELQQRAARCSLSDTGSWTNQNVVFTKALVDMFPLARTILKGALQRDECRGAHFKPDFATPGIQATDAGGKRREAEEWCRRFEESTEQWLKSTVAELGSDGEPQLTYEEVDTSLIPPRPRLYGLVGAEVIEEVWKERQAARRSEGNGEPHAERPEVAVAAS